ncbi:hypothetical protein NJ76_23000 [Rhodococcus sp. IITR03]|nr:hypothetical protein NJ76_23000 [Rhodococcus sp. IITR03]
MKSVEAVESRTLPVYEAGEIDVPFVIAGMDELVSRETRFEAHSHPTHELLWNDRGASTATIGSRTWTITSTMGLWIPAGLLHWGVLPAGTWYRTAHFGIDSAPSLSDGPVAVEMTSLLRLRSSPVRWCARSSRDSSSGYAVKAGVTSSTGSAAVRADLSLRERARTSSPR